MLGKEPYTRLSNAVYNVFMITLYKHLTTGSYLFIMNVQS